MWQRCVKLRLQPLLAVEGDERIETSGAQASSLVKSQLHIASSVQTHTDSLTHSFWFLHHHHGALVNWLKSIQENSKERNSMVWQRLECGRRLTPSCDFISVLLWLCAKCLWVASSHPGVHKRAAGIFYSRWCWWNFKWPIGVCVCFGK